MNKMHEFFHSIGSACLARGRRLVESGNLNIAKRLAAKFLLFVAAQCLKICQAISKAWTNERLHRR
jgi:hypothetical protein